MLSELWRVQIDKVPFIDEMLFSWESIRSLPPDFDGVIAILKRNNKQPTDAPPDLQPLIKDAQQRVAKLAELTTAVDAGNAVDAVDASDVAGDIGEVCSNEGDAALSWSECCDRINWDWRRGCQAWGPFMPPSMHDEAA